ncbi:putative rhamnosyl transferase [Klebsiella pneumoniae]|uniref:glycosyltransferase family 2 protein n=1 Tax=Klebsiella pneumoniae TaxID=573 RepID=UPI000E2C1CC1|nr:glycosyltransferase [Klebsiella pneumoniae]SYG64512.1 putative rhamnosyl transferase [Klebsiella pneumoniae]
MKAYIAIPVYNGGSIWEQTARKIREYIPKNVLVQVIDSGSKDDSVSIAKKYGFNVTHIKSSEFNHGGTRNFLVDLHKNDYDIVIFLTQDAVPEPNFYEKIVNVFDNSLISCAYGRQLPHYDANPISKHARYFNYPQDSYIASNSDVHHMGIKTVFASNSFSAYRISTFVELDGFPENTILSEDMYFAAKSIMAGYSVAYVSDAIVRHSHNYSICQEFKRYFDIGVFHSDESWIRANFGGAGGEGKKFLLSEFRYLAKKKPLAIPVSAIHNFVKILGYKIGQNYNKLPISLVRVFSMHRRFWD